MHPNTDKKIYRQLPKATYQRKNRVKVQDYEYSSLSRTPSNYNVRPSVNQKYKKVQLSRNPSQTKFKTRQEYLKGNILRRKNDKMVYNLKSELQTLKMQVSRLVNKETDKNQYSNISYSYNHEQQDCRDNQSDCDKQLSDSVSVTSQQIIDGPLRRLQREVETSNYDHSHYLQLENDLLKTQLRNLKNKYNVSKQQWKQKAYALQKKNQYLEISLTNSEQSLNQYKRQLESQVQNIRLELSKRNRQVSDNKQTNEDLGNQFLKQKMNNLYEELSDKNRRINEMGIRMDELYCDLDKKKIELRKLSENLQTLTKQNSYLKSQHDRSISTMDRQTRLRKQAQNTIQRLQQDLANTTKKYNQPQKPSKYQQSYKLKIQQQIKSYHAQIKQLKTNNTQLKNKNQSLKQLNQSHQNQITFLKKTIENNNQQIQSLSTTLRTQRQKIVVRQAEYRKLIDDTKQSYDRQILLLKQQIQNTKQNIRGFQKQRDDVQSKAQVVHNDKQRQINRWKAEYRLLKTKYDEIKQINDNKRQQMQNCFKEYKTYQTTNRIITQKNRTLQQSVHILTNSLGELQRQIIQCKLMYKQKVSGLESSVKTMENQLQYYRSVQQQLRTQSIKKQKQLKSQHDLNKQLSQDLLHLKSVQSSKSLQQLSEQHINKLQKLQNRIDQQDNKINKYIKQIKNKQTTITKLKKQIRTLYENQQQTIKQQLQSQLSRTIKQILEGRQKNLEVVKKQLSVQLQAYKKQKQQLLVEIVSLKKLLDLLHKQKVDITQQMNSVMQLYNQKTEQYNYKTDSLTKQIQRLQNQLTTVQQHKKQSICALQQQINEKQDQIFELRAQNRRIYALKNDYHSLTFNEALRQQIDTVKKLQQQIQMKNNQIYRLQDQYNTIKTDYTNLKSDIQFIKLQHISQKKNIKITNQIQQQQLKNTLTGYQKKNITLQQKIVMLIGQNKKKDNFIQNFIMSKKISNSQKQVVSEFLKNYEINVTMRNISDKIVEDSEELEKLKKYNSTLIKEITYLKEKITLYQAISISLDNTDKQQYQQYAELSTPQKKLIRMKSLASQFATH